MAFQKIDSIKNLSIKEIEHSILNIKKEICELNIKKYTQQSVKNHMFKHKKHALSQLMTLAKQKTQILTDN